MSVTVTEMLPQGAALADRHFLQTAYHSKWPPVTYIKVKCHFTAEIVQ